MEICSMLCVSLDGRGVGGRMYVHVWIPSLFTWNYHNILISYTKKKIKNKNKKFSYKGPIKIIWQLGFAFRVEEWIMGRDIVEARVTIYQEKIDTIVARQWYPCSGHYSLVLLCLKCLIIKDLKDYKFKEIINDTYT